LRPYLPWWLHRWEHRFFYLLIEGPRALYNKRVYRKLSRKEITSERAVSKIEAPAQHGVPTP